VQVIYILFTPNQYLNKIRVFLFIVKVQGRYFFICVSMSSWWCAVMRYASGKECMYYSVVAVLLKTLKKREKNGLKSSCVDLKFISYRAVFLFFILSVPFLSLSCKLLFGLL